MTVAMSQDRSPEPMRSESTLRDAATRVVRRYLQDLNGTQCTDLYNLMLRQVERPVLEEALRHCGGNMTRTAEQHDAHGRTAGHEPGDAAQEAGRVGHRALSDKRSGCR